MLGSLRAKARREVRRHVAANPSLRNFQPGYFSRIANFIFKDKGLAWFMGLYLAMVIATVITDLILQVKYPNLVQHYFFNNKDFISVLDKGNEVFLTVQATLIGVILPIAVALVSLLLQQRGQTFSSSKVDIYYRESRAFEIGASGIVLVIVLVAQQFRLVSTLSEMFFQAIFTQALLTAVHGFWLALNAWAIWRFMVISFTFINPSEQQIILRRFVARHSIPGELEDRFTKYYLASPHDFGLLNKNPSIQFKELFNDSGVIEVEKHLGGTYSLHDVRFGLIKWVITRWLDRTKQDRNRSNQRNGSPEPKLIFPLEIGQWSFDSVRLCRRAGGNGLTSLEKMLVKHGFVFRKVER